MSSEKFSLRWNDFEKNVSQSFARLRRESNLFDVTLFGDDHKQVTAHKLVLSACSNFFKDVLYSNAHSHPLIYLDGLSAPELNLVLDYIYQGEVQIYQENLDRFLEIAKKLKLDGLMATDEITKQEDAVPEDYIQHVEENEVATDFSQDLAVPSMVKAQKPATVKERSVKVISETFEASTSEVQSKFEELVTREEDNSYRCTVCEKKMGHKNNMRKHLETHLTGLSYDCQYCGKSFRTSNAKHFHISRKLCSIQQN